jgi:hypothetical protein
VSQQAHLANSSLRVLGRCGATLVTTEVPCKLNAGHGTRGRCRCELPGTPLLLTSVNSRTFPDNGFLSLDRRPAFLQRSGPSFGASVLRSKRSASTDLRMTPQISASPPLSTSIKPKSRDTMVHSGVPESRDRTTKQSMAQRSLSAHGSTMHQTHSHDAARVRCRLGASAVQKHNRPGYMPSSWSTPTAKMTNRTSLACSSNGPVASRPSFTCAARHSTTSSA